MSPKVRFQIMLEPVQLETMKFYERHVGVAVSEQIRRAVDAWLHTDPIVSKILGELPHTAEQKAASKKMSPGVKRR